MAFVDWSPEYTVKSDTLDHQHQKMFQIVNQLHDAIFARQAKDVLGGIIHDLITYTQTHFTEEERQMGESQFPPQLIEAHKAAHENLVRQVREIERRYLDGESNMSPDVLCFLVGEWLMKHILSMDKQYAPYMNRPKF